MPVAAVVGLLNLIKLLLLVYEVHDHHHVLHPRVRRVRRHVPIQLLVRAHVLYIQIFGTLIIDSIHGCLIMINAPLTTTELYQCIIYSLSDILVLIFSISCKFALLSPTIVRLVQTDVLRTVLIMALMFGLSVVLRLLRQRQAVTEVIGDIHT